MVEPARILLVDDYPANLLALEVVLESLGHPLVRAASSDEAIARLVEDEYAAVVLDVQMPGIDGLDTARRIRADPRIRHVPILFMTASGPDDRRVAAAYALGAVDYLYKPFEPAALRSKVNVFIELHQKKAELRRTERKRFDDAQLLRERLAGLAMDVGVALTREGELAPMLERCAGSLVDRLALEEARLWTLDGAGPGLALAARAGRRARQADDQTERTDEALLRRVLSAGEPAHRADPTGWLAAYPLRLGDRSIGAIALRSTEELPAATRDVLGTVADSIALGVERKRIEDERAALLARQRHHNQQLEALAQATLAMSAAGSLEALLDSVAARARQVLGAGRAVVELADGETWAARRRAADGDDPATDGAAGADRGETHEPLLGRDGRAMGSIRISGCALDDTDRRLLAHLAQVAAAVLENTRLYQETLAAESALRDANRSLERSNKELDQFAYVASHDLKTPLRGIANLSTWLEEDLGPALTPESIEHLALLRGRVHRLEGLIDGILDYSRAGRTRHKVERIEVGKLLREAIELLAPPSAVEIHVPPELPVLSGERVPLLQVFMNLIGNALKHGGRDDLRIEIAWSDRGELAEFTVRDNGAGIAPEYHQRIWAIFATLRPRDQVESTGIGLSVVKKAVESRGGQAWVDSEAGLGTAFHFTWPVGAGTPPS
jgi:signal transduction histidine kinase